LREKLPGESPALDEELELDIADLDGRVILPVAT
jgi:hypothetical protein